MRTKASLIREARAELLRLQRDPRFVGTPMARATIPRALRLLGGSTKTMLSESIGYLNGVIYLAPHKMSGVDLCHDATPECRASCIVKTGRLGMKGCRNSQLWKSLLYLGARHLFDELLDLEIQALKRSAAREGLLPAVRVDGTSDTGHGRLVAKRHPDVLCYDYTKSYRRALAFVRGEYPTNYHLTFSATGRNTPKCRRILELRGQVAVVFDAVTVEQFPDEWEGFPTVNADAHDIRPVDGAGTVAALKLKGQRAAMLRKARESVFVFPAASAA